MGFFQSLLSIIDARGYMQYKDPIVNVSFNQHAMEKVHFLSRMDKLHHVLIDMVGNAIQL